MKRWLALAIASLSLGLLLGCGSGDTPTPETRKQSDRLAQIQEKTGGDWNKLTPEDKDYLVKDLAHGSEASAKMLLGPPSAQKPAKRPGQ